MSGSNATATELTSQYISQVTSDLERNAKEQERITAEIAALQQQLAVLQHDHSVLDTMRKALGVPAHTAPAAEPAGSTVPSPRKKATTATGRRQQTKNGTGAQPDAAKRPRKKAATAAQSGRPAQPTLVTLIDQHLADQSEPRSAAEITAALSQAHPDRDIQATVVRTTLENLVARNKAQRTKQGRSVFYTAHNTPEPSASPEAEEQPDTAE
ncbi:hypothetical protein [Streptomyces sp. NPDC002676]